MEKAKKINKDGIIKQVPISKLEYYLNSGWEIGTGRPAWNKGLTEEDSRVYKYVEKSRGKVVSEETKHKLSIINKGKKWKQESIIKRTNTRRQKGFKPSKEQREKTSKSLMGHIVSEETRHKISIKNKGHKGKPLTEEQKLKISKHNSSKEFQEYQRQVKKHNNSFNSSKGEEKALSVLNELFGSKNVIRHYSEERYPFECDFYIKTLDLFIELNYHFIHGDHPFNINDLNDIKELEILKEKPQTRINSKGKVSKSLYAIKIKIWTIKDVEKLNIAINNKLNYLMFYKEKDFMEWVNTQMKVLQPDGELLG